MMQSTLRSGIESKPFKQSVLKILLKKEVEISVHLKMLLDELL